MAKPQTRWAIVFPNGHIAHQYMTFTRNASIKIIIKEYRSYLIPKYNGTGLTDAQLWRRIKAWRGCSVRRISMKAL